MKERLPISIGTEFNRSLALRLTKLQEVFINLSDQIRSS